jgi:spore germination cell wall hydrolase CwlJ-like protein
VPPATPPDSSLAAARSQSRAAVGAFSIAGVLLISLFSGLAVEARDFAIDENRELRCLALTIYFEARSEPEEGQHAVGHVVLNRVAHKRFPQSICRVIRQGGERRRHRCQFSWWCDGQSDRPRDWTAWTESRRIAWVVYIGASTDPTEGALWYHADYAHPAWRYDYRREAKIGRHIFYVAGPRSK